MSNGEVSTDGSTCSNIVNFAHEDQLDEEQSEGHCSEMTDENHDSEIDIKDNFEGQHNSLAPHFISNNHCSTTLVDDFGSIDVYSTDFGKKYYSDDESSDVSACADIDIDVSSSDDNNQNAYSGNSFLGPGDTSSEICSDVICLPYAQNTQRTTASDSCAKQVSDSNDSCFPLADSEGKDGYEKLPSHASTDTKNSLATFNSSCHQTSQVSVCQDTDTLPTMTECIGLVPANDAANCLHLPERQPSPCRMSPGVARRLVVKPPAKTSDMVLESFAEKEPKVEVTELAHTGIAANFSVDELILNQNAPAAKDANSSTIDGVRFVTLDADQNSRDFARSESVSASQKDIENEYDYVKYSRTLKPTAQVALCDHHPDVSQDSGDLINNARVMQLNEASVGTGNTVMDECSSQRHLQSLGLAAVKCQSRVELPLVEDGLSSGETDDNEDEGENEVYTCKVIKLSHQKPVYGSQCEALPKHGDNSELTKRRENSIRLNHQITGYEKEQTKLEQSHNVQVERAIQDIKSAIQQSKSLSMVQPANEELTAVTKEDSQPVWITRSPRGALARRQAATAVNTGDQRELGNHLDDDVDDDDEGCGPLLTRNLKVTNSSRTMSSERKDYSDTDEETNELLSKRSVDTESVSPAHSTSQHNEQHAKSREVSFRDPTNDTVLIQGVLFRVSYLGSTQLISEGQPTKAVRMTQAQEAVNRVKAPEGENQPSTDVDLFISVEKIMVLNTDIQEIIMDHALRTISYIADIGDLLVIMARRGPVLSSDCDDHDGVTPPRKAQTKICCHVFETEEAQLVAQSIGQAFHVAYIEYLKANGIESPSHHPNDVNYQEVLSQQEIFGEELSLFANKDMQKEVIVPKLRGEVLGMVIVESGWGSMLPTVVIANLSPTGSAARCGQLNIGDQIISVNGVSLVGLALSTCQNYIKATRNQTVAKLVVVSCSPVVEVLIKRPDIKYQLGFSVQNGIICSLLRGGIAERGGVRVGHRIIDINGSSVVATPHERIVKMLASAVGEIIVARQARPVPDAYRRLIHELEGKSLSLRSEDLLSALTDLLKAREKNFLQPCDSLLDSTKSLLSNALGSQD